MKSVLPKLQKFGEEDRTEGESFSAPPQSSKTRRKVCTKSGLRRAGEQVGLEALGSASKINLTCTNSGSREQASRKVAPESSLHNTKKATLAAPYDELRKLQSQQKQHPDDLSHFTLFGQGRAETHQPNDIRVLNIPKEMSGVDLEGASEWMAVPWEIPNAAAKSNQLACLLLCKGVAKAQLPRMNIADWKPGILGVPTFHCIRCFQRWMKKGVVPEECSEQEVATEGPAMCITVQSRDTPGNLVISGLMGEDGKPVKIRVEEPNVITELLKKEHKQRVGNKRANNSKQKYKRDSSDDSTDSDDYEMSSNEDLLDLPDAFKSHILNQSAAQNGKNSHRYMQQSDSGSLKSLDTTSDISLNLSSAFVTTGSRASLNQKKRPNHHSSVKEKRTLETNQSWTSFDMDPSQSEEDIQLQKSAKTTDSQKRMSKPRMASGHMNLTAHSPYGQTSSSTSHYATTFRQPSNQSLISRSSSTQTVYLEPIPPNPASAATRNGRQQIGSPSKGHGRCSPANQHSSQLIGSPTSQQRECNRQQTVTPTSQQTRGSNKRRHKEEDVHLPPLVDNDLVSRDADSQQQSPLLVSPFESRPETTTTENSDIGTHLPTLSPQQSVLQQERSDFDRATQVDYPHQQKQIDQSKNTDRVSDKQQQQLIGKREASTLAMETDHHNENIQTTKSQVIQSNEVLECDYTVPAQSQSKQQPQNQEAGLSPVETAQVKASTHKTAQPTSTRKQAAKLASAVVKQEFDKSQNGSESSQMRIRRKSKWGEETQQVPSSTSSHISSSFTQMPNIRNSLSQTNIQRLPSFQDDIPRRFGQKIVRKVKKAEADPKQTSNYNSKDLGNLIGNSGVDIDHDGSRRSSLGLNRSKSSRLSLGARILRRAQQHQEYNNIPMPIMGRSNSVSSGSRPSSSGLGIRIPPNKPVSNLLKETTMPSTPQSLVRLKPLEPSNPPPDLEQANATLVEPAQLDDIEQQVAELLKIANTTCEPAEEAEEKESEDSGLEDISEESEEEEDEFDFEIPKPIPELKDITPMSFTSSYAFSFYKMGGSYRQVYNKTHARTLEPLRVRRRKRKPPKVRGKKVK